GRDRGRGAVHRGAAPLRLRRVRGAGRAGLLRRGRDLRVGLCAAGAGPGGGPGRVAGGRAGGGGQPSGPPPPRRPVRPPLAPPPLAVVPTRLVPPRPDGPGLIAALGATARLQLVTSLLLT